MQTACATGLPKGPDPDVVAIAERLSLVKHKVASRPSRSEAWHPLLCCTEHLLGLLQHLGRVADRHGLQVLVLSGKGGVGKSTFAAQLAFQLAEAGKEARVCSS